MAHGRGGGLDRDEKLAALGEKLRCEEEGCQAAKKCGHQRAVFCCIAKNSRHDLVIAVLWTEHPGPAGSAWDPRTRYRQAAGRRRRTGRYQRSLDKPGRSSS